jgi:hypothetical protein
MVASSEPIAHLPAPSIKYIITRNQKLYRPNYVLQTKVEQVKRRKMITYMRTITKLKLPVLWIGGR